jgi:hypothetical protein
VYNVLCNAVNKKEKRRVLQPSDFLLEGLFMALYAADNDVKSAEHSPDSLSQSFAVRKPGLSLLARFLKPYNGGGVGGEERGGCKCKPELEARERKRG